MTGRYRPTLLIGSLTILMIVTAVASLLLGSVSLSLVRMAAVLVGDGDRVAHSILIDLRLPRTLLSLAVGATLGLSGAALQGYLRNPLAEPSVLGTSSSAALGAVIAFYFGIATLHPMLLPGMAIAFSLASLLVIFVLAGRSESPLTLILAGIAVSTLAIACISLALNLSPNPFAAMEITTWLMGSLENRSFDHLWIGLPCMAAGALLLLWDGRALDALTLGEDGAQALGVDLKGTRLRLMLGTAIGIGGAVSVSGTIGFIGLIVPHLVRPFTDRSPSSILIPSAIGGAALLTLADIAVRIIPSSNELKLGVVTAFLGVPVFMVHLLRARRIW